VFFLSVVSALAWAPCMASRCHALVPLSSPTTRLGFGVLVGGEPWGDKLIGGDAILVTKGSAIGLCQLLPWH
jgi:hypothetical protein